MLRPHRAALAAACVLCALGLAAQAPPTRSVDGAAVFQTACAGCHSDTDSSAPSHDALAGRSPQAIVDALTAGSMRYQGLALSGAERRAVAEYLTGRTIHGTVTG